MHVILMLALCPRMQCPISQMRTRVLGLFINLTEVLATIRWQSQEVNMDSSVCFQTPPPEVKAQSLGGVSEGWPGGYGWHRACQGMHSPAGVQGNEAED